MAVVAIIGFTACTSSDDDEGGGATYTVDQNVIQALSGDIGGWDEGFVTSESVFLLEESATDVLVNTLYLKSSDDKTQAALLVSKDDHRPLQLVMSDGTLNFSFLNDEVLELVYKSGSDITYVDQIPYNKKSLDAALAAASDYNSLQKNIFYFAKVMDLGKVSKYGSISKASRYFINTLGWKPAATATTYSASGVATSLPKDADSFVNAYVRQTYHTITVWTGKASFKVGGSSCTLSGSVFCSDPTFSKAGVFGIVCDKDQSKLFRGQAEFEGTATLKDDCNFDVDFRGFNPTTKYYYRAFYQISGGATGRLVLDPAQKASDGVAYDNVIKDFTTDENKLTVDVVMCMDISGSMSGLINMVKSNATSFYDQFKGKCDDAKIELQGLHTKVITYSDINVDGTEALSISADYDLTNAEQKTAFEEFVNGISLSYGGDTPESGLEALMAAFDRDWGLDDGYHRQVVILWTDAPYKTDNEGICVDEAGNPMFVAYDYDAVKAAWDGMPTGRRMIIFAPETDGGYSNGGAWSNMESWKNVIREDSSYDNLTNFGNSLDYIISELTGKTNVRRTSISRRLPEYFRPNR